jgi:hypothetical protein
MKALLIAFAAAIATTAAAEPQDAAIPPIAPAVRAEIDRGADAAFDCYQRFSGLTQASGFAACVQETHAGNQQRMGKGFEAFDAGLYFRAAQYIRIKIEVLQDGDPTNSNMADLTTVLGPLETASDAADAALHVSYDAVRSTLVIQ